MDLGGWLRSLGLDQYEATFRANEIDTDVLPELTEIDLEKLGVPLGHRKRLLKATRHDHVHMSWYRSKDIAGPSRTVINRIYGKARMGIPCPRSRAVRKFDACFSAREPDWKQRRTKFRALVNGMMRGSLSPPRRSSS